jgi:hypothetical protein
MYYNVLKICSQCPSKLLTPFIETLIQVYMETKDIKVLGLAAKFLESSGHGVTFTNLVLPEHPHKKVIKFMTQVYKRFPC